MDGCRPGDYVRHTSETITGPRFAIFVELDLETRRKRVGCKKTLRFLRCTCFCRSVLSTSRECRPLHDWIPVETERNRRIPQDFRGETSVRLIRVREWGPGLVRRQSLQRHWSREIEDPLKSIDRGVMGSPWY